VALPDFADPAKAKAKRDSYAPILLEYGFTQKEVDEFWAGPFDHKMVKVIDDARKWHASEAARKTVELKKAQPKPPTVIKPKAAVTNNVPKESAELQRLWQRAKDSGSDRDVAVYVASGGKIPVPSKA
jgi:hypothetical protein